MAPSPQPLYDVAAANPAYHLRYSWTGWPAGGRFETCPSPLLNTLTEGFPIDGLKLLEHRWTPELLQLTLSAAPNVSPATLAQRVKGRLDHAIRQANLTLPLSRKLAVRSLGENRCAKVEQYIQDQVSRERFADTDVGQKLKSYAVVNSNIDLVVPMASARGRYWYNLHVVLVTAGRHRITNVLQMCLLRDTCAKIAAKMGHSISSLVLMPDHLHVALRGNIEHSPNDIGRCLQNDLACAVGNHRLWADGFYVGSFGEYDMDDVRKRSQPNLSHHPGEFEAAVAKDVGPND